MKRQANRIKSQIASTGFSQNKFCTVYNIHQPTLNILLNAHSHFNKFQAGIKHVQKNN